jgi:hypothetical protein
MTPPSRSPRGTSQRRNVASALVALRGWQIATALIVMGIVVLWLSAHLEGPRGPSAIDETVREVGALLLVTGALSVLWDLLGRRALTEDVMAAANLAGNIRNAGLERVSMRSLDADWDALLDGATQVDLFFAYGRTWRAAHATALRELVSRAGTRLRVILPDQTDDALMRQLAAKFRYTVAQLRDLIEDAEFGVRTRRLFAWILPQPVRFALGFHLIWSAY